MFSVVVPLYNKEISIQNTIQSVLKQTYQNFEIIVVDDGSTDRSSKRVGEIQDPRIKVVHQKNQGVSAARNRGIQEAKYEWIALLDGDDLWEIHHLEEVKKMMQRYPNEEVYVTSFEYSDNRKMFKHPRDTDIFIIKNYFKEAVRESLIWTSIIVINKKCFQNIGYFNTNLTRGEDMDLWVRLAKKYSIVKSSKVTATYRVDAENRTSLSKDLEKYYIYYFNIDDNLNIDEKNFYKAILFKNLYAYLVRRDFKNVWKLKQKYPSIEWNDFFKFIVLVLGKKIRSREVLY